MEVIPAAGSGSFGSSAMASLVDESGTISGNETIDQILPKVSSQKTVELHTPYQRIKRRFNLNKWLGQTQETAWIQTQAANTNQVIRQFYNTPTVTSFTNTPVETTPSLTTLMAANTYQ